MTKLHRHGFQRLDLLGNELSGPSKRPAPPVLVKYADGGFAAIAPKAAGMAEFKDINRDRKVDVVDLGVLSSHWQASAALFADGDLNHDGMVDVVDLGILSSNWQQSLPTPAQPDGLRVTSSPSAVIAKSSSGTVIPPVKTVAPVKKVATSLTPIAAAILV